MSYVSKHNPTIDNPIDDLLMGIIATGAIPKLSDIQLASDHYKELRAERDQQWKALSHIASHFDGFRNEIVWCGSAVNEVLACLPQTTRGDES